MFKTSKSKLLNCMIPVKVMVGTVAIGTGGPSPTTVTFLAPELKKDGREFKVTVELDPTNLIQKSMLDFAISAKHSNQELIAGLRFDRCPESLLELYPEGKAKLSGSKLQTLIEWGRDDFNHR